MKIIAYKNKISSIYWILPSVRCCDENFREMHTLAYNSSCEVELDYRLSREGYPRLRSGGRAGGPHDPGRPGLRGAAHLRWAAAEEHPASKVRGSGGEELSPRQGTEAVARGQPRQMSSCMAQEGLRLFPCSESGQVKTTGNAPSSR